MQRSFYNEGNKAMISKPKATIEENNYNDRSFSNRTPLLEHYQNNSLPR